MRTRCSTTSSASSARTWATCSTCRAKTSTPKSPKYSTTSPSSSAATSPKARSKKKQVVRAHPEAILLTDAQGRFRPLTEKDPQRKLSLQHRHAEVNILNSLEKVGIRDQHEEVFAVKPHLSRPRKHQPPRIEGLGSKRDPGPLEEDARLLTTRDDPVSREQKEAGQQQPLKTFSPFENLRREIQSSRSAQKKPEEPRVLESQVLQGGHESSSVGMLAGRRSALDPEAPAAAKEPEPPGRSSKGASSQEGCPEHGRLIGELTAKVKSLEEENWRLKCSVVSIRQAMHEFQETLAEYKKDYEAKMNELTNDKKRELMENKNIEENFSSLGSKVFITDDLWKVVITIMSGIEMSVKSYDFDLKQYAPASKDYHMKNTFEVHHASLQDFRLAQFIDFAPPIFHYIRKVSGVTSESYIESLGPDCLSKVITGNMETFEGLTSSGKSGSFFFTSSDRKYLVKTIRQDEFDKLHAILPRYFNYISRNPASLISRILGLHKIVMTSMLGKSEDWTIIVMQNVLCTSLSLPLKFDIKGSLHKRLTA